MQSTSSKLMVTAHAAACLSLGLQREGITYAARQEKQPESERCAALQQGHIRHLLHKSGRWGSARRCGLRPALILNIILPWTLLVGDFC